MNQGRAAVTVVIAARNESANIEECLATVAWALETIVVENGSTDDTADRAGRAGATVINPPFKTIGLARNAGIEIAKNPWILVLDADERCTPELATEIRQMLSDGPRHEAYRVPRRNFFLGKEIRHGGWESDRPVRFFSSTLRYDSNHVHEGVHYSGRVGVTRGALIHYTYVTLDNYFDKFVRYSRQWAEQNFARGHRVSVVPVILHPPARFVSMYVLRGGWMDGGRGLILASLAAASVMAKYVRLWSMSAK